MAVKSVYVGNLPYSATEDEVRNLFAQWGPVGQVRLVSEKGFAFVDLPAEKLSDAIRGVNGQSMGGRALRVDEARPRAPREGGFRPSSEGGFRPSSEGGYRPSGGGGYRPSSDSGYRPSSDSGYRPSSDSGGDSRWGREGGGESRGGSRSGGSRGRDRNRDRGRGRRRDDYDY